MKTGSRLQHN
ncbi:hypothetical protein ECEC4436_2759, partial [Escherichia coli EC4436]